VADERRLTDEELEAVRRWQRDREFLENLQRELQETVFIMPAGKAAPGPLLLGNRKRFSSG